MSFDRVGRTCVVRLKKTNDGGNYRLRHVSWQAEVWTSTAVHGWAPLGLNRRENVLSALLAAQRSKCPVSGRQIPPDTELAN